MAVCLGQRTSPLSFLSPLLCTKKANIPSTVVCEESTHTFCTKNLQQCLRHRELSTNTVTSKIPTVVSFHCGQYLWEEGLELGYTWEGLYGGRSGCKRFLSCHPGWDLALDSLPCRHWPLCGVHSQEAYWQQLWEACTPDSPPPISSAHLSLVLPLAAPLCLREEQQTCVLRCSPLSSPTSGCSQQKPKNSVCFLSQSQQWFP